MRTIPLYSGQSQVLGGQIQPANIPLQQPVQQNTLGQALSDFGGEFAGGVLAKRKKEEEDAQMMQALGKLLRSREIPPGILALPTSF